MSNLKFYKSPFHITHDEEIADKMTEEVYAEMVQDKKLILLSLSTCLLYTSPSPRDATLSRMPSSA